MDDQSSTPDSEHTVRASKSTQQLARRTRLYELATRTPSMRSPRRPNPTSSPFTLDSPSSASNVKSLFKEDHVQPSARAHSQDNDYGDSLLHTFLPPDSPEVSSAGGVDLNEEQNGSQGMRSPNEYTGITMAPGQLGNLTTYGALARSTQPPVASGGNCGSSSGDDLGDLPFTPSSTRGKSNPTSVAPTPSRKWLDSEDDATSQITQSDTGNTSGGVSLQDIVSQTKTFPQLSREQGFRDWNNSNIDDRWMLQRDEMWKVDSDHKSTFKHFANRSSVEQSLLTSPNMGRNESLPSQREVNSRSSENVHRVRNIQQDMEHPPTQRLASHAHKKNSDNETLDQNTCDNKATTTSNAEEEKIFVPLLQEVERLQVLMRDINSSRSLIRLPYSPRIIRRYFYERCFGNGEGPAPLGNNEKSLITKYDNQEMTLSHLRSEVLQGIEELILYLMAPAGEGSVQQETPDTPSPSSITEHKPTNRDNEKRLFSICSNQGNGRSSIAQETGNGGALYEQNVRQYLDANTSSNPRHNQMLADVQQMLGRSSLSSCDSLHVASQKAGENVGPHIMNPSFGAKNLSQFGNRQQVFNSSGSGPQSQLSSDSRRLKVGQIDEEPSLNTFSDRERFHYGTTQKERHYDVSSSNGATQSTLQSPLTAWSSRYSSVSATPYQSPEKLQQCGNPCQQHYLPGQTGPLKPAQLQYINHQQTQYGINNSMPFPYGQQQMPGFRGSQAVMAGGNFGPNGMWIPSDRYVRPPATNRLAPLYAPNAMWPAVQQRQPSSIVQHPEWQNRFGTPVPALPRDNRKLPYLEGSTEMYRRSEGASVRVQTLTRIQPPDLSTVGDDAYMPFVETAMASKPAEWGVMKIGNIPYDLSKAQIIGFLGTHAKIITPELGPSVHIIMDRATGKTQDCYIEFFSMPDARAWVNLINSRGNGINRLSERLLDVRLSSQDELLKELFPRAKNVSWEGGQPNIIQSDDPYNSGFKTFVSAEELQTLVRHAEQPHRSIYTQKCLNRPYEAMISLLSKFPWQATEYYTLATRNKIFDAALKMLHLLSLNLIRLPHSRNSSTDTSPTDQCGGPFNAYGSGSGYSTPAGAHVGNYILPRPGVSQDLNTGLLKDLLSAALNAPGFSERQRWELHRTADLVKAQFSISPLAQSWPFEVLGRKRGVEEDVVEWYARLIGGHPLVAPSPIGSLFGDVPWHLRDIPESATLEEAGGREWSIMSWILVDQCKRSPEEEETE